jgi:hypothetical protein
MNFGFIGIITNWTVNEGQGGKTYSVTLTDPRRLLENSMVVVDTYSGPSTQNVSNVFNVYSYLEPPFKIGESSPNICNNFGNSGVINDRGMPYRKVLETLEQMTPIIYSPTGFKFYVDLSYIMNNIPPLPEHYRVNGPAISILQIITDVCEALGYDFYVYLDYYPETVTLNGIVLPKYRIKFGLIDLTQPPPSFDWIINNLQGQVTERSYGKELRVEKQKTLIIGEKVHYMSRAIEFLPYFGEDTSCQAIYGTYDGSGCGFIVTVDTTQLAASMRSPIDVGKYTLTETDIRCAMGSETLWKERVKCANLPNAGTFNQLVKNWLVARGITDDPTGGFLAAQDGIKPISKTASISDFANDPTYFQARLNRDKYYEDFKKIHSFVETLGRTYYGKQYLAKLEERICYRPTDNTQLGTNCISSEIIYSSEPTNEGAWIELNEPVIGLTDPYLGFFRQDDGRVGSFALFNATGEAPATQPPTTQSPTSPSSSPTTTSPS